MTYQIMRLSGFNIYRIRYRNWRNAWKWVRVPGYWDLWDLPDNLFECVTFEEAQTHLQSIKETDDLRYALAANLWERADWDV